MNKNNLPHLRLRRAWRLPLVALTLAATVVAMGVQPALAQTSEISGFIWNDANGDGSLDDPTSEPRYGGVTVNLYLDDGDGVAELGGEDTDAGTTTTDGVTFLYEFTGLGSGDYWIEVVETGQPFEGWDITSSPPDADANPYLLEGVTGTSTHTVNFGYQNPDAGTGSIGDYVWDDTNGNGVVDAGELGLDNITVALTTPGDDGVCDTGDEGPIATQSTIDGSYDFTGLSAATYCVEVDEADPDLPSGYVLTTAGVYTVDLADGQDYNDADFGFRNPASGSIGDLVWRDDNANGLQDGGEPGIVGVSVALNAGTCASPGAPVGGSPLVTSSGGGYLYTGLAEGSYCVNVDETSAPVNGWALTTGNDPLDVTLTAGQALLTADFGFEPPADAATVIAGQVFQDWDANGVRGTSAAGLEDWFNGLTVNLYLDDGDGVFEPGAEDGAPVGSATTSGNGDYTFNNLPVRTYWIDVDDASVPTGYTLSTANEPQLIAAAYQTTVTAAQIGFAPDQITVSGQVLNNSTSAGIDGVTVEMWRDLTGDGPSADDIQIATTATAGGGNYSFTFGGPDDDYYVNVDETTLPTPPGGWTIAAGDTNPAALALTVGQTATGVDFAYDPPVVNSISGVVWDDANGDGIVDAGETTRFANVTVTLNRVDTDCATVVETVGTQTTAADGAFAFTFLADDDYCVAVNEGDVPLTHRTTRTTPADNPQLYSVAGGTDVTDANFGYQATGAGAISGVVWLDLNDDGVLDAGEVNLAGVQIDLYLDDGDGVFEPGADDGAPLTTASAGDGAYSFSGLPDGDYFFDPTPPTGYVSTIAPAAPLTLSGGAAIADADFGFRPDGAATIGDLVWNDDNGNAVFEPGDGETGFAGVQVHLYQDNNGDGALDGGDTLLNTQTTDASGNYTFPTLLDGDYIVDIEDGDVAGFTLSGPSSDPQAVTISGGASNLDVDFGYTQAFTIGDLVWNDANDNSVFEPGEGETGIDGVTLNLYLDGGDGLPDFGAPGGDDVLQDTTATSGGGQYIFTVQPGSYWVQVDETTLPTPPPTYVRLSPEAYIGVTITDADNLDADFRYRAASEISGNIWYDEDGEGDPDEFPLSGIGVDLYQDDGDDTFEPGTDDTLVASDFSDANGQFFFFDLAPGTYWVDVDDAAVPPAFVLAVGTDPLAVTVASGEVFDQANFGYDFTTGGSSIGDLVFQDFNGDGVQNGADSGVTFEVGLSLYYDANDNNTFEPGTGDFLVGTTTTNATGVYSFTGLPAGDYFVEVDEADADLVSAGASLTTDNPYGPVTIGDPESLTNADFGFQFGAATGRIGDLVFEDLNGDGALSLGEPGLNIATVNLYASDGDADFEPGGDDTLLDSLSPNLDGTYEFTSLPAGDYWVHVDPLSVIGYELTTSDGNPIAVNLPTNDATYLRADFGFRQRTGTGSISGRAWEDLNDSGPPPGAGEIGLSGVDVFLWFEDPNSGNTIFDGDEALLGLVATDGDGDFAFQDLPAGRFYVDLDEFTLPMNYVATTGTEDYLVVVLNDGQAFTEAYFGYRPTGTADISGRVWSDADGDGNQDAAEVGLNGVQVQLWRDDGDNSFSESADVLFDTVITAGDGDYVFDSLPAATYFVNVDGGTIPSLPDPPTLTGGTNPAGPIALANGASETADFGYQLPNDGIIQGLVWDDADGDNVIDGSEAGLPDVRLTLLLDDGDGDFSASDDLPVAIQDTASDGSYSFANVADDELYFVVVTESTLPPGYTRVDAAGNENPRPVDTSTGGPEYEENFAYRISDNIGFTLTPALLTWADAEPGEEQGFTHTLENTGDVEDEYTVYFNCAAVPSVPSPTCTIVSGNQGWSVNDQLEIVLPGSSTVTVQSGSGLGATFTLQPGETATLSHTIRVPLGSVAAGTQDTSRIAVQSAASGEDQQADDRTTVPIVGTITGSVFHDINSNAVQDSGEPGLPNITLSVFRVVGAAIQPLNITVESNADGAFTFTGLPANGNFAVFVDAEDPDIPSGLAIANDRRNVTLTNGQQGAAVRFPFISPAPADPQLSKSVSPTSVPAGSTITFTLTVRNNGQQAATNVVVTDPVSTYVTISSALVSPVGRGTASTNPVTNVVTFTIPQLDVGETVTLSITGTVQSNLPAGTQITNRATLAFTEAPGTTRESNTVIASVTSGATTSGLSKSVSLLSAAPGQNLTYTLQYTNTTGQTVTNVVVTDLFNSFLSINSASVTPPDRGTFNIDLNARTVTFTLPIVNVNETITMTVNTLISTSIPPGITISNVASFTSALQPTAMQSNTVSTIVSGAAVATSTPISGLPPGSSGPPGTGGAEPPFGTGGPSELPETGGRPRPAGQGIDEPATTNRLLFLVMTILSLVPALALVAFGVRRTRPRVGVIRWRLILVGMVVATLLLGVLAATTTLSVEPLLLAAGLLTLAVMLMGLAMVWRNRAFQERDRVLAAVLSTMTVTALVASTLLIPYYNMPAVEIASGVDDGQVEEPAVAAAVTETADAGALSADMWDVSKYADQFPAEPEVIHRIAIPALNLNRAVVEAAIDGKSWNITTFDREVAHLEGTSYPGITGNVVLAGHITLASGGFGPFKDLNRLVPGDVVVLYGPERQYVYQIEAVDVLGRKDIEAAYPTDEPTLTLITCTNWSPREWAYLQRLVVRARLMPERSATYY